MFDKQEKRSTCDATRLVVCKALLSDTELPAERRFSGVELCGMRTGGARDRRRKLGVVHPVHHIGTV